MFAKNTSEEIRICFIAAAIAHDTAISPFGHLMEEALSYLDSTYHHESKWSLLLQHRSAELGGTDLQLYLGYQSEFRDWAEKFFGVHGNAAMESIVQGIAGSGKFGQAIAGGLDLDNLDNVTRAAFHMGLDPDRKLPLRLAACLEDIDDSGVVFSDESVGLVRQWLTLREQVYSRFMLSIVDFSGKLMLLSSMVEALKLGVLSEFDWIMTDGRLIEVLLNSKQEEVSAPLRRWLIGDLWDISELVWFDGKEPPFSELRSFADQVGKALSRPCFAYRIKDKRTRQIALRLCSNTTVDIGEKPRRWLLGIGSPLKGAFTRRENRSIVEIAESHFGTQVSCPIEHAGSLFA
jgi:hypothetical protein